MHPFLLMMLFTAATLGAEATAPVYAPVAHSALVVLEAARTPAGISLRAHRADGAAALAASGVTVAIDGRSVAVRAQADGSWSASWPPGDAGRSNKLDVVLAHDGIRELLSGTLPAAARSATPTANGLLGDHKQMAWWVLNIAIVLIAVLALSRRMS